MKAVNVDDVLKILHKYDKYIFVTDEKRYSSMVDEIANLKALKQESKTDWIPVSNPRKELPKDRELWVTIDVEGHLAVRTLYYDMTEWSENFIDYVSAYMNYVQPVPYKAESKEDM